MDSAAFLRYLRQQPVYEDQIVHAAEIPPREAENGSTRTPLPEALADCLKRHHLMPLYIHQADAINLARQGRNVVVATPSASGKTLCYDVPVMEALLTERASAALYIYPTKALAQDQFRSLRGVFQPEIIGARDVATFDGDTPKMERGEIRKNARLVLTNPDMLHLAILPNHRQWSRFLRSLKYVVLDEAHSYRGVFGSHVALVMRRLRRLCRMYGADPQFIACSATIANPADHAARLVGLPFETVSISGAPFGGKDFVFWNPPLVDARRRHRRSANSEAAYLTSELIAQGTRTLTFAKSRRLTELINIYVRRRLAETGDGLAQLVKAYRAGYLPEDRRRIERELAAGELLGVVATNALELGIDIGSLEATVLTGYPGSVASTWQQAGRSGRRRGRSLSFLVGLEGPLDQYLMQHPDYLFEGTFEHALVNPGNPYVLRGHLLCAAWEMPLVPGAVEEYFGKKAPVEIENLAARDVLRQRQGRWYLVPTVGAPAAEVNIRSASGRTLNLTDATSGNLLENVDWQYAIFQLHPGAVYLHQGESFLVSELDLEAGTAVASFSDATYYTQARDFTELHVTNELQSERVGPVDVYLGEVEVKTTVVGFQKKAQSSDEVIGEEPLELPPQEFHTIGLWIDLPVKTLREIERDGLDLAGGLHGAEHAMIAMLPLFALCDRSDIGGVSTPCHADTGRPQIFIYDAVPGGVGIAEQGFRLIRDLWRATLDVIAACPCDDGCPGCIQSPKCGNNNIPLDKIAAARILGGLLEKGDRL